MNEQRTPEEQLVLQQHAENISIVENLLGWKRDSADDVGGPIWRKPATATRREEQWYTPSFTTWAEAGLILDAMQAKGKAPLVYSHELNARWEASFAGHAMHFAETGPLAIRIAAIEYIKAVSNV
jgi:hypothetical protein